MIKTSISQTTAVEEAPKDISVEKALDKYIDSMLSRLAILVLDLIQLDLAIQLRCLTLD